MPLDSVIPSHGMKTRRALSMRWSLVEDGSESRSVLALLASPRKEDMWVSIGLVLRADRFLSTLIPWLSAVQAPDETVIR